MWCGVLQSAELLEHVAMSVSQGVEVRGCGTCECGVKVTSEVGGGGTGGIGVVVGGSVVVVVEVLVLAVDVEMRLGVEVACCLRNCHIPAASLPRNLSVIPDFP
eukprot:5402405-Amphidinium_carterae.2